MKTKLSFLLAFFSCFTAISQEPTIEGDTMICPDSNGTASIVSDMPYDSYTWYWKYWFTEDPFVEVEGANGPTFTYDWLTYDQALIKVVVTLNGQSYESNTIQIDSYAFSNLILGYDDAPNISFDPNTETIMLCQGTSFTIQTYQPYTTNIRWYRNGEIIENENNMELVISQPGSYNIEASPAACPDFVDNGVPINVMIDTECDLNTNPVVGKSFAVYPNPATDLITVESGSVNISKIKIYNMTGQMIFEKHAEGTRNTISLNGLSSGMYVMDVIGTDTSQKFKIVKN